MDPRNKIENLETGRLYRRLYMAEVAWQLSGENRVTIQENAAAGTVGYPNGKS